MRTKRLDNVVLTLTSLFRLPPFASSVDMDGERYNKQDTRFSESPPGAQFEQSFGTKQKGAFFLTDTPVTIKKKNS